MVHYVSSPGESEKRIFIELKVVTAEAKGRKLLDKEIIRLNKNKGWKGDKLRGLKLDMKQGSNKFKFPVRRLPLRMMVRRGRHPLLRRTAHAERMLD